MKLITTLILISILYSCGINKLITDPTEPIDIIEPVLIVESSIIIDEAPMSVWDVRIVEEPEESEEPLIIVEVKNRTTTSTTNQGKVVYKIPTDMTVRSTYQVVVRISKSTLNIYENLNGEVKTSSIPITETMEVKLIDVSPSDRKVFDIIADNSAVQLVENNEEITQWTWNIIPIRSGSSKLKIVISVIRDGITKETVYVDDVTVKADVTKTVPLFISNYWQWLFSTLLLPLFYWIYARRKKKKAEK